MKDTLKLLMEKLTQNEELKKEIEQNPPKTVEEIKALSKRLGLELGDDDLAELGKVSEEDINQIAGGNLITKCGKAKLYD